MSDKDPAKIPAAEYYEVPGSGKLTFYNAYLLLVFATCLAVAALAVLGANDILLRVLAVNIAEAIGWALIRFDII